MPRQGWAILFMILILIAGHLTPARGQTAQATFVTIAAGQRSAITTPIQVVIRDAAAWVRLWSRHAGAATAHPPAVDFGTEMVIALFAGRASASTAVAVARILYESDRVVVQYTLGERRPLPMGEEGPAATPFHIVRVARSTLPVTFQLLRTPPVLRPGPGS